ncbi:MAG: bile acid:sodium symporter family protein [Peptoniphilaceae bacterium]|nr:bile acid:sodium symporter family protein [Peptoniphilaceae bacterium]MDY6085780.1 bile acid:sodium symporter family protein [Peptoniphilaceae bacterium]
MDNLKKFTTFVVDHMIVFIFILSIIAFCFPDGFSWMTRYTSIFLAVAMFGMGTTIDWASLKTTFLHPQGVLVGIVLQFLLMPAIAYALCKTLPVSPEIMLGVILVGSCPGGTASNVITHIAGGDVTLSVTMTTVSTLLAPFLTPVIIYMLAGELIEVSLFEMFLTVVKVILIPVFLGILAQSLFRERMKTVSPFLPFLSSLAIILIISGIIALNADKIRQSGLTVTLIALLHNLMGLGIALGITKLMKLKYDQQTAIAIEVGMQNSGLAVSLATANFAAMPMASLPGALFSVVQNLTGSFFASLRKRHKPDAPAERNSQSSSASGIGCRR